jgi:hypothetical protein
MTSGLPEPSSAAPIVLMARVGAYRGLELGDVGEIVDEREVDDPVGAGG